MTWVFEHWSRYRGDGLEMKLSHPARPRYGKVLDIEASTAVQHEMDQILSFLSAAENYSTAVGK